MKVKDVIGALERFAPLPLQDSFDNAGLQVGLPEAEVTGALLCLDVTEEVMEEAVTGGYNLVISHHPLIFKGCKSITGKDVVERCILMAIKHNVAVYSAHTNLDNAPGGVNFKIAGKIGLENVHVLEPKEGPWNGEAGEGVIGELVHEETEPAFLRRIKETFNAGCVRHSRLTGRKIKRVALCGGASAYLVPIAVKSKADVFLTGEVKYHEYFNVEGTGMLLAEIGHYESEQYTKELLYTFLRESFPALAVRLSRVNTNPVNYLL
ncbi:MAG: Nif3-like dinuclear metal center hexameric protein [Prevotellaceae bacterium]|nr:Nif3-like dinuclear metal center hexameric protein [Prevotellaceae bacterium]